MAEATAGNAVAVCPGDVLVVAFAHQMTPLESDEVAEKIAAGLPPGVRVLIMDNVQALAVVKGHDG